MTVNPFWLGVLMTIVIEVVLTIIGALIAAHRIEDDDEDIAVVSDDEIREMLENAMKEAVREATEDVMKRQRYSSGIEDRDNG